MKSKIIKHRPFTSNTERAVLKQHFYLLDSNCCLNCQKKQKSFSMLNEFGLCSLCAKYK